MPEMLYVDSTNIEAVGYDAVLQEMHVQFVGGTQYVYEGVPEYVFHEFITAPSKGSFFNRRVRGVYQFRKA